MGRQPVQRGHGVSVQAEVVPEHRRALFEREPGIGQSVLGRDKFDRYLERETRLQFVALYRRHVRLFPVSESEENTLQEPCRDSRDNKFLALALVCAADAIVSSDEDLLSLNPYRRIPVILARDFLEG